MHPFSVSTLTTLLLALTATAVRAQTSPAVAPAPTRPEEPVDLDRLVVSASPAARSQADVIGSASVLADAALREARQPSLGETLVAVPGVSSTYFGPGASRPILRGLGANRVRVLANSTDTLDASNTSPDHAVAVEPFLVKRIEVVRGPAALLHGSAAIGGVVNVIDHRIESELPDDAVSGVVEGAVTDNGAGYATGGAVDVALAPDRAKNSGFVLHLDGFRREADDVDVPGFSGQAGAPKGQLVNSAVESKGASGGLSYVSERFDAGLNYNGLDTRYGVPNEEDVAIALRQRRLDASADLSGGTGLVTGLRTKFGYADYEHRELEGAAVGTVIGQEGFDHRLELLHGDPEAWSGAVGLQLGHADLSATGDEAFLPTHTTDSAAVFVFEELVRDGATWQAGLRVEPRRIEAEAFASPGGVAYGARDDERAGVSGSFGAIHPLGAAHKLAWTLSATERAPTGQELYADGPHVGTAAYEIGDADFDDERSLGAEVSLRRVAGPVTGSLTGYVNTFDGYLFEEGTGVRVDETNTPDPDGELQRTRFVQRDALFCGAEAEAVWRACEAERQALDFTAGLDYVHARERDGDALPRIPPFKARLALDWRVGDWHAGMDWVGVAEQTDTAPGETATDGYGLLGLTLARRFVRPGATCEVFLRASNLTDEEARVHTSFLKDIAPLPGRAATIGARLLF